MKIYIVRGAAPAAIAALMLSGCATTGQPQTAQQRIAQCAGAAVLGALLGAAVSEDELEGAAIGAAVAGGACGVWQAFDSQQDQQRIAQLEMQAAMTGQTQTQNWMGPDNRRRVVTVQPAAEMEMITGSGNTGETVICRPLNTTASVDGQSQSLAPVYCRSPDGTYALRGDVRPVA